MGILELSLLLLFLNIQVGRTDVNVQFMCTFFQDNSLSILSAVSIKFRVSRSRLAVNLNSEYIEVEEITNDLRMYRFVSFAYGKKLCRCHLLY